MVDPQLENEVEILRQQGLADEQITQELTEKGYQDNQIQEALLGAPEMAIGSPPSTAPPPSMPFQSDGGPYERIEEIAEAIVDEKWDALLAEVRKVIEWKGKVEEDLRKSLDELSNLKEDFKELRQAVLGKVEEYDRRMLDVSTELKAVGKVFKDVIPTFTDNVKQLDSITKRIKK